MMFGHQRFPPGLASSACNLRIAMEIRLLIVPSGASTSFANLDLRLVSVVREHERNPLILG